MNNISPVVGPTSSETLREFASSPPARSANSVGTRAAPEDRVEISELASFLSRLAELPDVRAKRIVQVRNAIAGGTYETPEKLDVAVDRLLDQFSQEPQDPSKL